MSKIYMSKKLRKLVVFILVFLQSTYFFLYKLPLLLTPEEGANFINASATLSNSRLSYRAGVTSGSNGSSTVTIDSSGNADNNTNHLFPRDIVCFTNAALSGCIGNQTYQVANIVSSNVFNTTTPLNDNLDTLGYVMASQSAIHTITFTLANTVPVDGDILITIPAIDITGQTNDGLPDTNSSIATNGFDLGGVGTSNIAISSSGCGNNWTIVNVTAGTASTDHTIRIDRNTNSCAAGSTITVTIGDASKKLINPAPITTGHTQGIADVYTINVKTRDGADNTLDEGNIKVAIIEGVLVSANVEETLSVTIVGVNSGQNACGQTTDITTTATSVPWGTISNFGNFYHAAQTVTVSTNASSGYVVKIEENDQMGKDGKVCTGANAGESDSCIQDTTCGTTACSESTSQDWTSTSYYGLGYSLQNVSGTDATFIYNESGRTFSSKQFPDMESSETKQTIMSKNTPVASSQVNLCYRLNVSATQPAGYYYNKVQLTATASF